MSAETWYLDSSALVKLVVREQETETLSEWVQPSSAAAPPRLVTCELARVEVVRAVRHHDADAVVTARDLFAAVTVLRIDRALCDAAADLAPPLLRSLDAVHLAAALSLGAALTGVITYDARMRQAAHDLGVSVEAPGA